MNWWENGEINLGNGLQLTSQSEILFICSTFLFPREHKRCKALKWIMWRHLQTRSYEHHDQMHAINFFPLRSSFWPYSTMKNENPIRARNRKPICILSPKVVLIRGKGSGIKIYCRGSAANTKTNLFLSKIIDSVPQPTLSSFCRLNSFWKGFQRAVDSLVAGNLIWRPTGEARRLIKTFLAGVLLIKTYFPAFSQHLQFAFCKQLHAETPQREALTWRRWRRSAASFYYNWLLFYNANWASATWHSTKHMLLYLHSRADDGRLAEGKLSKHFPLTFLALHSSRFRRDEAAL